jgi:hypothetical protein
MLGIVFSFLRRDVPGGKAIDEYRKPLAQHRSSRFVL